MSRCPNWRSGVMQSLVKEFGKEDAFVAFIKNGEEVPTLENARKILGIDSNKESSTETSLSRETIKELSSFMTKRGIRIIDFTKEESKTYSAMWGLDKKHLVSGLADTTKGIIGYLEGKKDVVFGAEAAHMTFAMLKESNPKLAAEMFNKIGRFGVFDKVLRDPAYSNNNLYRTKDGKPDIMALKEEAIGKLLKEHLANETGQANKLEDYERVLDNESPENVSKFQQWFAKVMDWFKQLFNKYDDNPFKEVAKQMLGTSENEFTGTKADLRDTNLTLLEIHKTDENLDNIKKVDKTISLVDGKFKVNDKDVKYKVDEPYVATHSKSVREVAEKGNLDLKDILSRYINEDGSPSKNKDGQFAPEVKTAVSNLDPNKEETYRILETNMIERLMSFPEETKFAHNVNVFNGKPNGKAARVDLLAFTPDGKTHVYNFDFITNTNVFEKDIPLDQQNAAREYMREVKGILSSGYGIKVFGESRSIPIKIGVNTKNNGKEVSYKPDSIEIGGVKTSLKDHPYLRPVPTFDERGTDIYINKLIDKLLSLYNSREASSSKGKMQAMDQFAYSIRNLQLEVGVPILNAHIKNAITHANFATKDFIDSFKGLNPAEVSKEELRNKSNALAARGNELNVYKDSYLLHKDKVTKASTQEETDNLDKLKEMSEAANVALFELESARRDFVAFFARKWKEEDVQAPEKDLSLYGREGKPFNDPTTSAEKVHYRIMKEAEREWEHKIAPLRDELVSIQDDLKKWEKGGKKFTDMLDLIKERDDAGKRTNRLLKHITNEFYEQYNEAEDKAERNDPSGRVWIRQNVDMPALKKFLEERRSKRRDEINQDYPLSVRAKDQFAQQEWTKDMTSNNKWNSVLNDKVLVQFGRRFPKKDWETKEFRELIKKGNEPVKRLYDYIQKINELAAESGYIQWDKSKRFLPFMFKSLEERMVIGGEFSFANSILRSLTISDVDINHGKINVTTNEAYKSIPKYFTYDMKGRDVSEDLISNIALYMSKVVEYSEKEKIRPLLEDLLWLEKNKDSLQTNQYGRLIPGAEPKHDNTKNYEALMKQIDKQLFDIDYTSKVDHVSDPVAGYDYNKKVVNPINKFVGFKLLSEVDEGGRYSMVKTIAAVKNIQMAKTLGLNMSVPLYRWLSTNILSYVQAGEWYNHVELSKAELRHGALQFTKNNAELQIAMMKTLFPVEGQLHTEIRRMSMSRVTRDSLSDWMMMLTKRAHDWIQYVNYDAMINNAVVIDGKMLNARKFIRQSEEFSSRYKDKSFQERKEIEKGFEAKVAKLIEENGFIKKSSLVDGKLTVEGLDLMDESVTTFMNVTRNMGLKLSGNITKENEINARRNAFVRMFMMFKSWLPGQLEDRFHNLDWKEGQDSYQWGRIRMIGSIAKDGLLSSLGRITSMLRATDKGMGHLEALYNRKKEEYEENTGKEFKMTQPEFYDLVRSNITKEVKDVAAQLTVLGGVMTLYAAAKDADKHRKGEYAFAIRVVDRSLEELNMYYYPPTMNNIANGQLLPMLGFFTDLFTFGNSLIVEGTARATGDKKMKKTAHVPKHFFKLFPIASQVPNWIGVVMPEYMKQFGYAPEAKKVHH